MTETPNLAQREYWDAVAGPKWVRLGTGLESRLEQINSLLLQQARPTPGECVLDVGCGTGPTTLPVAGAIGADGHVLGIDIAEPMLAAAQKRMLASSLRNVTLELADAQTHQFTPNVFDLVISRFGVMFFDDPVAAFANLLSAMRLGGRLCFVCWGGIADNPHWQLPMDIAMRHLGPPAPRPAHAPGPLAFSDGSYVMSILADAGFREIAVTSIACDLLGVTLEQEVDLACLMGPSGSLISEHKPNPSTLASIKQEIAAAFMPYATKFGVSLPAGLLVARAARLLPDR